MEENLRVIPSDLEVIKQEFERKNLDLGRKIEKLEEEKMYLSLDVDVQKIEVKKWQQEVQEERAKVEYWEKKFQEMQAQNQALEKDNQGLKAKVTELGRSLHHHRNRNSAVELKASLNKIEEMKHNIEGLEIALQNCELQIEQLEAREGHWKGELHHFQDQEQLAKIQQQMKDQMLEVQRNMMAEMAQLLKGVADEGKTSMTITEEDNEDHPPGFIPPHVQTQPEAYP
ncbi:hypothetical protein PVK06_005277 [Gossypium arboreum]|uniref:Uncharacterized protein n=1 Tax=Gossypium arboreum TaxID=29729 RepID=A0ABR0QU86_GOSAR|nr:hypothetical protein PVK06_005277 [Gossypium arboreum]